MLYELARAAVQKIFQDKIWMGLTIIGILAIFGIGMSTKTEPAVDQRATTAPPAQQVQQASQDPADPAQNQSQTPLDPALATDFLKWWMANAFDYAPATAAESHGKAFSWMTPDAKQAFQTSFWTPEVAAGITNGTLTASFKPATVQAEAVNPDGSIVVGVLGAMSLQNSGQEHNQQVQTDFLIRRDQDGLRVAGIYSRSVSQ